MKSKNSRISRLFVLLSACALGLSACGASVESSAIDVTPANQAQLAEATPSHGPKLPHGQYKEGYVLVKSKAFEKSMLGQLKSRDIEPLYQGSPWYEIQLANDQTSQEAVDYLDELGCFEDVDYDYIMASDGEIESIDVSSNPLSTEQAYIESQGIGNAWGHLKQEGKHPGGSRDVVVAVIDTGVDYNHIDLRNNIWTNAGEIPNNGVDDDKNGYVDDYYGWDCVGEDNDPMDDNGHGTHVAGIVAAENNNIGTVGVAYNCRVMCLKAGNSSGYFNNSDIAQAIQYAYMNGASVINMSFGGSVISRAAEDALEDAYNQCVLVAAAGNDSLCNQPDCIQHFPLATPAYPAALPYVIGVMSTNGSGTTVSSFSNFDHHPFNSIEYEVYACGEQIPSTWPHNKTARLSGTSMACPVVAGIAALLRSKYSDRETYSNKFIQSQIVNTGSAHPINQLLETFDWAHSVANVYEALMTTPKPSVQLYDYYIFDNENFSPLNNGNGIVEPGETIRIALELYNRGGVASNVVASIDTIRNGDSSLVDPYFDILINSINVSDIGTYSIRDFGKIYDGSKVSETTLYFEVKVSDSCPNDYLSKFNLHLEYRNGLDSADALTYQGETAFEISVMSGYVLPSVINQDTVFSNKQLYFIGNDVTIPSGVSVVFEAGSSIRFFSPGRNGLYVDYYNSPRLINYGDLRFAGSQDDRISIKPSELYETFVCYIENAGSLVFEFCDIQSPYFSNTFVNNGNAGIAVDHCTLDCSLQSKRSFRAGSIISPASGGFISEMRDSYLRSYDSRWEIRRVYRSFLDFSYSSFQNGNLYVDEAWSPREFISNCILSRTSSSGDSLNFEGRNGELTVRNNVFTTLTEDVRQCSEIITSKSLFENNTFLGAYYSYFEQVVHDYMGSDGQIRVDKNGISDFSMLYPFVTSIKIFNSAGEEVHSIGREKVTFLATFSRAMNQNESPVFYFGSIAPYSDYAIRGDWISETEWLGEFEMKSPIENGTQFYRISRGVAALEDSFKTVKEVPLLSFNIDTTSAMSMMLQGYAFEDGIRLDWFQDDYDTLMGYNVYRSTEKDGNFVKLNNSVIPAGENSFVDENAEPGVNYWYTFTVVFSDFTESAPAGKVSCRALDTIAPSVYHTPVNQGYLDNNLVISCTASDNIGITGVTLYYRTVGENSWKTLSMSKQNDRYSATIFGSELSLDGLEYYIVASDEVNTISKGNAETPYSVLIKDASAISRIGDVDGDGVVTTRDALMIIQSINGDLLLSDDEFIRADLNGDGVLNSMEALRILQYINGNVNSLSM